MSEKKMIIHKDLAGGRWFTFSFMFQMANVSADVGRAISWKNKGDKEESLRALFRVLLNFLILPLQILKIRAPRRKELLRVREALVDYFMYDNIYGSSDDNYFYAFNYAAALEWGR